MSITRRGFLRGVVGAGLATVFGRKALAEAPKQVFHDPVIVTPIGGRVSLADSVTILEPAEFVSLNVTTYQGDFGQVRLDIPVRSLDVPRLLRCIAEKETRNRDHVVGASGERSRYQIKRSVWHRYEAAPFAWCRGERAYCVALQHVNYLRSHLNGTDSAYLVAMAWNGGPGGSSRRARDYATCVENLYNDPSFVG